MTFLLYIVIVIASFFFMEFVAWFTHKYVMHGFLWILHKDHHIRDGRKIERNDLFAVIFALPSIILIIAGINGSFDFRFYIGIGIALYGTGYFLFHDVYVHQRVKLFKSYSNRYLSAISEAHRDHHTYGSLKNYGFLIAPAAYYRKAYNRQKS